MALTKEGSKQWGPIRLNIVAVLFNVFISDVELRLSNVFR